MRLSARVILVCTCLIPAITVAAGDRDYSKDYSKDYDILTDVVYGHKYSLAMTMDVLVPKKGNGAGIVWLVSGGWHSGLFPPEAAFSSDYPYAGFFDCRALLDRGFTVFFVRHGDGSKFPMPEIVNDCRQSIRYIRINAQKFKVDPERLGALGGSAGGYLALMLATTSDEGVPNPRNFEWLQRYSDRVATVAAYYPPTDIRDWWATGRVKQYEEAYKFDPKRGAEFSPLLWVSPYSAPALMIHGDKDFGIPISYSTRMVDEYKKCNVPCELLTIPGVGHGFDIGFKGFKDYTPEQMKILVLTRETSAAWFEKMLLAKKKEVNLPEKAPAAAEGVRLSKEYAVVDLSKGVDGPWPVSELDKAPDDLLKDDAWRTTKLLLRRVGAGKFAMGAAASDKRGEEYVRDYHAQEKPHSVTLTKAFYVGVFPVTQEQWTRVMGYNPSYFTGNPKRPVETVSYNMVRGGERLGEPDAKSFIARLRKGTSRALDLPTEAQWEYACRAGTPRALNDPSANKGEGADCTDANVDKIAWYEGNSQRQTHDVGLKAPNAWGLYDMCGNVSQWCVDRLANFEDDATDPVGPAPEKAFGGHILRGGYWSMCAGGCRSSARDFDASAPQEQGNTKYNVCGFRLVLPAEK